MRAEAPQRRGVRALVNTVALLQVVNEGEDLAAAPRCALLQSAAKVEHERVVIHEARHQVPGQPPLSAGRYAIAGSPVDGSIVFPIRSKDLILRTSS